MAPVPLLATKLYQPSLRPGLVARPRLIQKLNDGACGPLSLISAPAGFGKTTLLSEWMATCHTPTSWLSLDSGDNDPIRFWSYLISAIREIVPQTSTALEMLQSPQAPDIQTILIHLLNIVTEEGSRIFVVLDDYHFIENRSIHNSIAYLVDHLPESMHLIVASRTDPPWPLAHWRMRGQLVEVRTADLRFKPEEAANFLNRMMKLAISEEDVLAIEKRTEGWIAGLQMVALSLQGQEDPRKFIARFTGSNRYIFDYLLEEVLGQQTADIRDFLLKTSILDQMTASLCEAVTGNPASQAILKQLEQANLFITALDDERRWYRYHHLFMDLLRTQLKQEAPGELPNLYQKASRWYQEHRAIAEALRYALAAKDTQSVGRMVAQNAFIMVESGELEAVIQSLDSLPPEAFQTHPWLSLAHAWGLSVQGQFGRVEGCLQTAEEVAAQLPNPVEIRHVAGHTAILRAFRAGMHGEVTRSIELAEEGLRQLPETDAGTRGFAYSIISNACMMTGRLNEAVEYLLQGIELNRGAGNTFVVVDGYGDLAREYILLGKLHLAAAACKSAFQYGEEIAREEGRLPVLGFVRAIYGEIHREWNQLQPALNHTREGAAACRQAGQTINLMHCLRYMVATLLAIGDYDSAAEAISQIHSADRATSHWSHVDTTIWEVKLHLKRGELEWVRDWVARCGLSPQDDLSTQRPYYYLFYARVLAAIGKVQEALVILEQIQKKLEREGYSGRLMETLPLRARLLYQQGEKQPALSLLEKALRLGAPEGYTRVFLDEGEPILEMLLILSKTGEMQDYTGYLLSQFEKEGLRGQHEHPILSTSISAVQPALVEPLTERELEVLRLLKTSLNTIEIAAELFISVTTVRTHIKNIYSKLEVNRRLEAVERAEALKIL